MIEPLYGVWVSDDYDPSFDHWRRHLEGGRMEFTSFADAEKAAAEFEAKRSDKRFHYRAVVINLDPLKHHTENARAYEQWCHENKQEVPKS
jgi:hypothetical protein